MNSPANRPWLLPLCEVFPLVPIRGGALRARRAGYVQRIKDEITLSGVEGLTWIDISCMQARGTWDVLELLAPESLPLILPGYLQWLYDPEEGDTMVHVLPNLVVAALNDCPAVFSPEQLNGLSRWFSACLGTERYLEPDQVECYEKTLRQIHACKTIKELR
jgi:hypothetical protein